MWSSCSLGSPDRAKHVLIIIIMSVIVTSCPHPILFFFFFPPRMGHSWWLSSEAASSDCLVNGISAFSSYGTFAKPQRLTGDASGRVTSENKCISCGGPLGIMPTGECVVLTVDKGTASSALISYWRCLSNISVGNSAPDPFPSPSLPPEGVPLSPFPNIILLGWDGKPIRALLMDAKDDCCFL